MSSRIESVMSKDNTSKWSKNESFDIRKAGVDIGEDVREGGKSGGSSFTTVNASIVPTSTITTSIDITRED